MVTLPMTEPLITGFALQPVPVIVQLMSLKVAGVTPPTVRPVTSILAGPFLVQSKPNVTNRYPQPLNLREVSVETWVVGPATDAVRPVLLQLHTDLKPPVFVKVQNGVPLVATTDAGLGDTVTVVAVA